MVLKQRNQELIFIGSASIYWMPLHRNEVRRQVSSPNHCPVDRKEDRLSWLPYTVSCHGASTCLLVPWCQGRNVTQQEEKCRQPHSCCKAQMWNLSELPSESIQKLKKVLAQISKGLPLRGTLHPVPQRLQTGQISSHPEKKGPKIQWGCFHQPPRIQRESRCNQTFTPLSPAGWGQAWDTNVPLVET